MTEYEKFQRAYMARASEIADAIPAALPDPDVSHDGPSPGAPDLDFFALLYLASRRFAQCRRLPNWNGLTITMVEAMRDAAFKHVDGWVVSIDHSIATAIGELAKSDPAKWAATVKPLLDSLLKYKD